MTEYNVKVTDIGVNTLLECINNGTVFPAVKMAVGDSNGSYYEPSYSQTDLVNKLYTANLYAKGKRNGYLYFDLQLPPSVGGFTVREVGLFDNEDNLLAVSKYPETYKQQAEVTSNKTLLIEIQIQLSNEAFNNIIIDDSGNLITEDDLTEHEEVINNNINNVVQNVQKNDIFKRIGGGILEAPNGVLTQTAPGSLRIPKGLKVRCFAGRNPDNTLNSFDFTVPDNIDYTLSSSVSSPHIVFLKIASDKQSCAIHLRDLQSQYFEQQNYPPYESYVAWFDNSSNTVMEKGANEDWYYSNLVKLGFIYASSGTITALKSFQPLRLLTYSDRITNLEQPDYSQMSSITYNTVFTAPDDGLIWITSDITVKSSGSYSSGEIRGLIGNKVSVQNVTSGSTETKTLSYEYGQGTYTINIPVAGYYKVWLVGGGGNGASGVNSLGYMSYASGGSGAAFIGDLYFSAGNHTVQVGSVNQNTVIDSNLNNGYGLINAGEGGNGSSGSNFGLNPSGGSAGGLTINGTTQNVVLQSNGNAGSASNAGVQQSGGASVYNGYGKGGASNGSPSPGYFKLYGTYQQTSTTTKIVEEGSLCYRHNITTNEGALAVASIQSGSIKIYKGEQFILYPYRNLNAVQLNVDIRFYPSLLNSRRNI